MLSTLNGGNALVVVGLCCLGAGFWLPYGTAARVYRIETRAADYAAAIRDELRERGGDTPLAWTSPDTAADLARACNERLGLNEPGSLSLRTRAAAGHVRKESIWLEGKHYLFMVTRPPASVFGDEGPIERPGEEGDAPKKPTTPETTPRTRPLEVYAWPKDKRTGGQSVFYFPTTGRPAFHRNLGGRYTGPKSPPLPGAGFLHHVYRGDVYYGQDDKRWQFVDGRT